ncbi:signal transduction histidine kinase [Caulobacter ginsengisoli]|uniref:histidine kinase n=1 Tax=Caulobacter ginsengisoli TaxID=400775 RepID=A0ABU0IL71_9CAUL|nr:ATP-binding protein [Caulobacter ginsengisoli]MDQ0462709.1 signal transduction histidine kinase [Caulobacter ginsengisoli]
MASRRFLLLLVLLSALIAALSAVSMAFFRDSEIVVSFWPANALILAFLLRGFRGRTEAAAALAVSFGVLVATTVLFDRPAAISVGFAAANMVEVAIAAWVMRGQAMPLRDERALLRLIGGGVIAGPLASCAVAGLASGLSSGTLFYPAASLQWLVADMLGMAVFAPAFLSVRWRPLPEQVATRDLVRNLGVQALVAAATVLAFLRTDLPLLFAITPCVMLAVWTGRAAGGTTAVAIATAIAALMSALGFGPIAAMDHSGPQVTVLVLQAFVAGQILAVHPLAMALSRLDAYAREAERRAEMRERLLAHVSHEIRSPLGGVLGLTELMQKGALGELTAGQREGLANIALCAAEVEGLAGDLLDEAAINAGRLSLKPRPTNLADIVTQAHTAALFRTRDFKPEYRIAPIVPGLAVLADPARFKQILVNLLVNAAKYGGRPPRVEVSVEVLGARIRVLVADNGAGVPAAQRDRLFQPFERLGAVDTDVQGHGIGLAVARQLARLQDGDVGLQDGPLGGACFYVDLPLATGAVAA